MGQGMVFLLLKETGSLLLHVTLLGLTHLYNKPGYMNHNMNPTIIRVMELKSHVTQETNLQELIYLFGYC